MCTNLFVKNKLLDLLTDFKHKVPTWSRSPSSKSFFVSSDKCLRITGARLIPVLTSNGLNRVLVSAGVV